MFCEWSHGDWGYGWFRIPDHEDSQGVSIQVDPPLNIVVVLAFGKQRPTPLGGRVDVDATTFLEGTPYETTVGRTTDTLVWIGKDGRSDLCMDAGVGAELLAELGGEEWAPGGIRDALSTVLGIYRGTDAGELGALVDRFRAAERN